MNIPVILCIVVFLWPMALQGCSPKAKNDTQPSTQVDPSSFESQLGIEIPDLKWQKPKDKNASADSEELCYSAFEIIRKVVPGPIRVFYPDCKELKIMDEGGASYRINGFFYYGLANREIVQKDFELVVKRNDRGRLEEVSLEGDFVRLQK